MILPLVGRYGGRIIDTAGDGILAEFPSVINATECAVEIQTIMATRNEGAGVARRNHLFLESEPAFGQFLEHTRILAA